MVKGFIFDMDGTMVDNMMIHHYAWQAILKDLGLELSIEEVKEKIHGINEEIIKRLFGHRFNDEQIHELAWKKEARYREIFKNEVKLIDGLSDFFTQANALNIPMSVGTAAPPENVDFIFENIPIRHFFKGVVHSAMVEKGKPNPEVFEKAAATLHLNASDCIIFEDSPTGAQAAHNAGAKTVVLLTTHCKDDFKDLPNIIAFVENFNALDPVSLQQA